MYCVLLYLSFYLLHLLCAKYLIILLVWFIVRYLIIQLLYLIDTNLWKRLAWQLQYMMFILCMMLMCWVYLAVLYIINLVSCILMREWGLTTFCSAQSTLVHSIWKWWMLVWLCRCMTVSNPKLFLLVLVSWIFA